jgi:hypothetical protein
VFRRAVFVVIAWLFVCAAANARNLGGNDQLVGQLCGQTFDVLHKASIGFANEQRFNEASVGIEEAGRSLHRCLVEHDQNVQFSVYVFRPGSDLILAGEFAQQAGDAARGRALVTEGLDWLEPLVRQYADTNWNALGPDDQSAWTQARDIVRAAKNDVQGHWSPWHPA